MKHYGLIGQKLGHSFSRDFFTEKFRAEQIEADYSLLELATETEIPQVLSSNWAGLNVTFPYKKAVISHLDHLDNAAAKIGAVNTIRFVKRDDGCVQKIGYNTDYQAFKITLEPLLTPEIRHALILGTGGAAQAVAFALQELNINFLFVSRFGGGFRTLDYAELDADIISANLLIINATPLGTWPEIDSYPTIPYERLTANHLLYDLVYNPETTQFLQRGKTQGCRTKNGLEMLHLQAELSYKIWQSEL